MVRRQQKKLETEPSDDGRAGDTAAWRDRWQPNPFGGRGTLYPLIGHHWRQSKAVVGSLALGFAVVLYAAANAVSSATDTDRDFWIVIFMSIALAVIPICASLLFMPDQRRRSYRFLAHHGALPATVWWSRQLLGVAAAILASAAFFSLLGNLCLFAGNFAGTTPAPYGEQCSLWA